jgi:hypothetical protein
MDITRNKVLSTTPSTGLSRIQHLNMVIVKFTNLCRCVHMAVVREFSMTHISVRYMYDIQVINLLEEGERMQKYDKQDQQGKGAFNERSPHTIQQQEPMARSPGGPQTKTGQGTKQNTDRQVTKMIKKNHYRFYAKMYLRDADIGNEMFLSLD